ncbi:nickel/cobalt transporter [Pantoea sp. YU22]|uniref:nickel/cobalt transporter n=1 Tax=Pantoea TaxID=53335 RepID=UPI000F865CA0|nr:MULTISPECIES: nickel/cobalt transporter [Pantoea]RTY58149.1 nickel/cobalt transporter [Pantoea sp. YU22]
MKKYDLNSVSTLTLLGFGGLAGLALLYLFARHWADFVQYCFSVQVSLHRYLVQYLLLQRDRHIKGGLMLVAGSFIYGFLHSVGPGHGKFVITTWLATHRAQLRASRLITLLGSLMQGIVAILFVVILAVSLNLSLGDLSLSRYWMEKASALLIAGFGLVMLCRAAGIRPLSLLPVSASRHQHNGACGCGHKHQPAPDELTGGWRNAAWVIGTIGIRPCSGALMILVFANAVGMFSWGVAAVTAMSLGTAASIMILATFVHHFREWMINVKLPGVARYSATFVRLVLAAGGVALILFAAVMFSTIIPVSTNGDFIAAGC